MDPVIGICIASETEEVLLSENNGQSLDISDETVGILSFLDMLAMMKQEVLGLI